MMGLGVGLNGQSSNIFGNPMGATLITGSMYPTTQRQLGMMTLAGQSQMMGIGSGQLSGVRPGPSRTKPTRKTAAKPPGNANEPAGLAARYFNRFTSVPAQPQSYYNRQNHYFPQGSR
jgi:hypothetical protein